MKIKKFLFINMLFIIPVCANAQMIDIMGSMGVGGAMDAGAAHSVGMANNRLKSTQLISDINMKMADIMMSYEGRYHKMPTQTITSAGKKVVFRPVNGRVEAYIEKINENICLSLLTAGWQNVDQFRVVKQTGSSVIDRAQASKAGTTVCQNVKDFTIIFK